MNIDAAFEPSDTSKMLQAILLLNDRYIKKKNTKKSTHYERILLKDVILMKMVTNLANFNLI